MKSFCLSTEINPERFEIAAGLWWAMGMTGAEEEPSARGIRLRCYFRTLESLNAVKADLLRGNPHAPCSISEIPDQDWNAAWKASMKPALVAPGFFVSPEWLPPLLAAGDRWIKIEPKTAFGTGHHATTRLAAAAILDFHNKRGGGFSLLDIGSGAGILCFIAALCGARLAVGVDIDVACAENMAENRRNNPSKQAPQFAIGPLDMFKAAAFFDCIVMNMIRTESQPLLGRCHALLCPEGYLLWSGLLIEEKSGVIDEARKKGFILEKENTDEEWWGGAFRKITGPLPK